MFGQRARGQLQGILVWQAWRCGPARVWGLGAEPDALSAGVANVRFQFGLQQGDPTSLAPAQNVAQE